jgi:hypothetical protein
MSNVRDDPQGAQITRPHPQSVAADVAPADSGGRLAVPVKIAQQQLGHASIATTLNIYTHVVDASHRNAIEPVEKGCSLCSKSLAAANDTVQDVVHKNQESAASRLRRSARPMGHDR